MKTFILKRSIAFILTVLLCALVCSCSGRITDEPADSSQNVTDTDETADSTGENTPDEHEEPPAMLIFYSMEEYARFSDSTELPDDEFMLYISENSFDMNGISSKEDAAEICGVINSMPAPYSAEMTLTEMIIYPERDQCFLKYKTEEGVSCSYLFNLDKDNTAAIQPGGDLQPVSVDSDNIDNVLYVRDEIQNNFEAYYAVIDNYSVLFRMYDSTSAEALELLTSVGYSPFAAV